MKYDVIIIGGGLGGLIAGAKLAKQGKSLLLLEQHDRPGGCATSFSREPFTMEVGLHEMDGLHPEDPKRRIFDELGLFEKVKFLPVPEFFRFCNGRTDIVIPHNREQAIRRLKEQFPSDSKGIDAYFHRLMNALRINVRERNNPDISIGAYLDEIIQSDELKLILLGNLVYFHDDPYSLSLRYFSRAEAAYFHGRANFVQGGSQQLSNALMEIIREHGGKVLLNHKVTNIRSEKATISGVDFINVMPGDHAIVQASAHQYVANAALPQVVDLLGENANEQLIKEVQNHPTGCALLTVYFGFSKPPSQLGHTNYSTFVMDPSVVSPAGIQASNRSPFEQRGFTFVDYSQIESGLAPAGKSVGAICCTDYIGDWIGLTREEYLAKKRRIAEVFQNRLNHLIPGISDHIEHREVATAMTVRRYTLNPDGTAYGFAQMPNRPEIRGLSAYKNLFIASAWGKYGGGFSGAMLCGYQSALEVIRVHK